MIEVDLGKTKAANAAGKKATRGGSAGGDRVDEVMEVMKKAILEDEFVFVENSDVDEADWENVENLGEGWEEVDKTLLWTLLPSERKKGSCRYYCQGEHPV